MFAMPDPKLKQLELRSSTHHHQANVEHNPFLKICGGFPVFPNSNIVRQPNHDDIFRLRSLKQKVSNIMDTPIFVAASERSKFSRPLPDDQEGEDSNSGNFVKRVVRGKKPKLFPKDNTNVNKKEETEGLALRQQLSCTSPNETSSPQRKGTLYSSCRPEKPRMYFGNKEAPQSFKITDMSKRESYRSASKVTAQSQSDSRNIKRLPSIHKNALSPKKAVDEKQKPLIIYDQKQLNHIKAQSYIIIEHPSQQMVLMRNAKQPLEIASLTKIMTYYAVHKIVEQFQINIDAQKIVVDPYFEQITGTTAEILEGDIYTVRQLLYGLMLPSGNDAATCLANWAASKVSESTKQISERLKIFMQEMNRFAKQLGLKCSKFCNPTGLSNPEAKSSAYDVARLTSACMEIPTFREIVVCKQFECTIDTTFGVQRGILWENTNKLLRRQGFIGVKTGITVTAGPCLASCFNFRGRSFITVLLRTNKVSRRFKETRKILYYALNKILPDLTEEQTSKLESLRRNRRDFDSDNSEDEQEFNYSSKAGSEQYAKRNKILKYEL